MYKKSKQRTLIILFVILLIVVAVLKFIENKKGDRTFTSDLIKVDTSAVTVINFSPKSTQFKEVELYRNVKSWNLKYNNNTWSADPEVIKAIFSQVSEMKVERIAATDQSKWKELGVSQDEGVRVKLEENNKIDADFIVGKISYSQSPNPYYQRGSMNTYIRLVNSSDDKVYAVSGYLSMIFNRDLNSFRNGTLLNVNKDRINKLIFSYPADSSFVLQRKDGKWFVNDTPADSVSVNNYLNTISHLSSNEFDDGFNYSRFTGSFLSLTVEGYNLNNVYIKAYTASDPVRYVLISSINSEGKFRGDKNDLFKRVFIGKHKLIHK